MKKIKGIFLILFALSFFACKTSSDSDDGKEEQTTPGTTEVSGTESSTDNPSQPAQGQTSSVKSAQYFWGIWQRMDNGKSFVISESDITVENTRYSITDSSETSLSATTLGTFEKQTGSVMVNNSIPYFRKGGTNLEYTMKLVGFEEDLSRAARAASSTSLAGYTVTGKSDKYGSYESTSSSESDGSVTLTAPVKGDTQTVTVTSGSTTITVVPGIKVETNGSNMGTIPISQEGQYSLKVTGTIDESEKDDGYLYGNNYKSYPMTLTITNVSDVVSAPSVCSIMPADSRITVSSADGSDITGGVLISTLKSGFTKTILLSVTCGMLTESYLDTGLIVTVKNAATEKTWQDYVPLRFFKGLVPITVAAESVEENADAALNGFVIYPDGNSQFFSVPDKGDKTIYVPTFGSDQPYTLAFSGATIEGTLSKSTEMLYTVASGTWTKKEINTAATAFIDAVQYGETGSGNGSEDNATVADSEFEAYLADGDVDFYLLGLKCLLPVFPNYNESYTVTYESDYGSAPSAKTVSIGTVLTNNQLQQLAYKGYDFNGWYIGSKKIEAGFVVTSNITLKAKWSPKSYSITYNLNGGENNSLNPDKYTYSENEESVIKLENPTKNGFIFEGWYSTSSFSDEIITEIHRNIASEVQLYAKWEQFKFEVTADTLSNLDLSKCKYNTTIIVTGDITENTIISLAEKIKNATADIHLDLSKTIGLTDFTGITYPNTTYPNITEGKSIFDSCNYLKSINLPDSILILDKYAFYECSSLESVNLPDGLQEIGLAVFAGCRQLNNITIPDTVNSIGHSAFVGCHALAKINIPNSVTDIDDYAFMNCTNLSEIILREGIKKIGLAAFRSCSKLLSIIIPISVNEIEAHAFAECSNLQTVEFLDFAKWQLKNYTDNSETYIYAPSSPYYLTSLYKDYYWYKEE